MAESTATLEGAIAQLNKLNESVEPDAAKTIDLVLKTLANEVQASAFGFRGVRPLQGQVLVGPYDPALLESIHQRLERLGLEPGSAVVVPNNLLAETVKSPTNIERARVVMENFPAELEKLRGGRKSQTPRFEVNSRTSKPDCAG